MEQEKYIQVATERYWNWICEQRDTHRPTALSLTPQEKEIFVPYFGSELIDKARFKRVDNIRGPEMPIFNGNLQSANLFDEITVGAAAFNDTILETTWLDTQSESIVNGYKFHELVHVLQADMMGPEKYVETYIRQWVNSNFSYWDIDIELSAFVLGNAFMERPDRHFNVKDVLTHFDIEKGDVHPL